MLIKILHLSQLLEGLPGIAQVERITSYITILKEMHSIMYFF